MLRPIVRLPQSKLESYRTGTVKVVAVSGPALPGELALPAIEIFGDVLYNLYGAIMVRFDGYWMLDDNIPGELERHLENPSPHHTDSTAVRLPAPGPDGDTRSDSLSFRAGRHRAVPVPPRRPEHG